MRTKRQGRSGRWIGSKRISSSDPQLQRLLKKLRQASSQQAKMQIALAIFAVLSGIDLAAELAEWQGSQVAKRMTKVLMWTLMPTLIVLLLLAVKPPRGREVWLAVFALVASWLGDALPGHVQESYRVPLKIGLFQLAQIFFIAAFAKNWRKTLVYRYPWLVAVHGGALLATGIEGVRIQGPRALLGMTYVASLHVMTMLANGTSKRAGVGGALFLLSDTLIILREFKPKLAPPPIGFWVISTYLGAQALLLSGLASRNNSPSVLPDRSV